MLRIRFANTKLEKNTYLFDTPEPSLIMNVQAEPQRLRHGTKLRRTIQAVATT